MDDADRAEARIEETLSDALEEVHRAMHRAMPAVGACHYCGEPLGAGGRFCDADCRDAYEHEQRMRLIAGRG